MVLKSGDENSDREIVGRCDLHGQTKEKAIASLTSFLSKVAREHGNERRDSNNMGVWVEVITGSGKHSQNGPVLRSAVQFTLERRRMTYELNPRGKGSFLVQVDSGIELQGVSHTQVDTKVLTVPHNDGKFMLAMQQKRCRIPTSTRIPRALSEENDPLPSEVVADDEALARCKRLSVQDMVLQRKTKYKVAASLAAEELDHVLKLSLSEVQNRIMSPAEEQAALEFAINESIRERKQEDAAGDVEMQKALRLSVLQNENDEYQRRTAATCEEQWEDGDLEEILQTSLKQFRMSDDDLLNLALNESEKMYSRSNDQAMRLACEESKREASFVAFSIETDDDEREGIT